MRSGTKRGASGEGRGARVRTLLAGAWRREPTPVELSAVELSSLLPLLVNSGAAALVWRRLRDSLPADSSASAELRQVYRHNILQAARREHEIRQVFAQLRSLGVEPILIKGWAVARLYPEKGLRPYGDIDLCVSPEEYSRAKAALESPGDLGCRVDLEHDEMERLDVRGWDELFSRSRLLSLGDAEVRVLSPEDDLRLLCIHLLKEGARRPLWLCDIALAVESRPADFDWGLCLGVREPQAGWVAITVALAGCLLGAQVDDTPAACLVEQLPLWLAPSVLKQWGEPCRVAESPFTYQLRRPAGLLRGLRNRWPNPLEAAVATKSPLASGSPLPAQLRAYLSPSRARKLFRGA